MPLLSILLRSPTHQPLLLLSISTELVLLQTLQFRFTNLRPTPSIPRLLVLLTPILLVVEMERMCSCTGRRSVHQYVRILVKTGGNALHIPIALALMAGLGQHVITLTARTLVGMVSAQPQICVPAILVGQVVYVIDPFVNPIVLLVSILRTVRLVKHSLLVQTVQPLFSARTTYLVDLWL
jgi:hypothetical protein